MCSVKFHLISSQFLNLGGRRGTTDDVATIPFPVFYCPQGIFKPHSCPFLSNLHALIMWWKIVLSCFIVKYIQMLTVCWPSQMKFVNLLKASFEMIVRIIIIHIAFEPQHDKTNKAACAPSKDSDQPGHPYSLIRVFTVRMEKLWVLSIPLSTQQRLLIRLGRCPGWSESSLGWAHMPFYWFCHEAQRNRSCGYLVIIYNISA